LFSSQPAADQLPNRSAAMSQTPARYHPAKDEGQLISCRSTPIGQLADGALGQSNF
jgi:hypothetical protein